MATFLEFEKPIAELEGKIAELRHLSSTSEVNIADELGKLQSKLDAMLAQVYSRLTPWQTVQVARHVDRPHALDYMNALFEDLTLLAGDRSFSDDPALIGGLGRINNQSCVVIGTEKGSNTQTRIHRSFGMPRPEGYRKAQRLMRLADRFGLPIVTFVDTPGAYPGVDAEARGQAEAIARSIETCLDVSVPIVAVVIGEGGSGGALALAVANRVLMLEHAIYSVISPEGCASILWRDAEQAPAAAQALKLTAKELLSVGVIDTIICEPPGGAHRAPAMVIKAVGEAVASAVADFASSSADAVRKQRGERFLAIGRLG